MRGITYLYYVFLVPLLVPPVAFCDEQQVTLRNNEDSSVRNELNTVEKLLKNATELLINAKGKGKGKGRSMTKKEQFLETLLHGMRAKIEEGLTTAGVSMDNLASTYQDESGGKRLILSSLHPDLLDTLYDTVADIMTATENGDQKEEDIGTSADSSGPADSQSTLPYSPDWDKEKGSISIGVDSYYSLLELPKIDTSSFSPVIDHDVILQGLGGLRQYPEHSYEDDQGAYIDSITATMLQNGTVPNSFQRYDAGRMIEELKLHRRTGRWSERAVLEEFFFAVTGVAPEDEKRWKTIGLVTSGKWLSGDVSGADHCKWEGVTCGSTTVGPGLLGMEDDDDDDANCAIVAGVKTCKAKKTRCDGTMDTDEILDVRCPPKDMVTKIDLTSIPYLNGTLISNLYMLSGLHRLNLMKNNMYGTVPPSFSEFKFLEFLDVSDNHLTSTLPLNLPNTLEEVWFENNNFTGSVPDDLDRLEDLRFIDISNNQITGTIPSYFAKMTRLYSIALAGNKLTGSIPNFDMPSLDVLDFADNKLTGMPDLFPISLNELLLGSNLLKGPFPDEKYLESLSQLNVTGNDFTGEVPTTIQMDLDDDSQLYYKLWLSFGCDKSTLCKPGHNILCSPGYFSPFGAISELGPCQVCPLSKEELEKKMLGQKTCSAKDYVAGDINGDGVLSEREILQLFFVFTNGKSWGKDFVSWENMNTKTCDLPGVSCNGDGNVIAITPNNAILCAGGKKCHGLPSELGLLNKLNMLALSGASRLKGSLPTELGKLENLSVLKLDKCLSLTGSIPTELGNLRSLKILNLSSTGINGNLPSEFGNLSTLTTLDLSLSSISGTIPPTITEMKSLKQLVLSRCRLSGRIPENIQNLSQLENLELYGNGLTGSIPGVLRGMSTLKRLDVYSNKLTGTLPDELGLLNNLQIIHVKDNRLTGTLPSSVAMLPSMTWLDASNNNISGTIDPAYGDLSTLVDLKVGGNKIHGPIPESLCTASKLNEGMTSRYGCDAILCPLGTYSTSGYAALTSECKPCPSGQSSLHLGATACVPISQKEILSMFFDVMGGESWDEDKRRGWKTLENVCDWSGVSCDSNGEVAGMEFQLR